MLARDSGLLLGLTYVYELRDQTDFTGGKIEHGHLINMEQRLGGERNVPISPFLTYRSLTSLGLSDNAYVQELDSWQKFSPKSEWAPDPSVEL